MLTVTKNKIGFAGEELASVFLDRQGWEILARNWRIQEFGFKGEIDLIARKNSTVIAVEVKTRASSQQGGSVSAISPSKIRRLRKLLTIWLEIEQPKNCQVARIDGVFVQVDKKHLQVLHLEDLR